MFKALADEHRLRVLEMLCGGEMRACRLLENLSITQPTLWYHMKILTDSGLVWVVREDATVRYGLNAAVLEVMRQYLSDLSANTVTWS